MSNKVLEVLIPTYRRPQAAIGAIDSVLASANPNVGAFCHSNGIEPELEMAAAQRPELRYACFPENRGAIANFRKILEESNATYVLFLSDEDRIDPTHLDNFIDFLSRNQHGFVMCSVVESTGVNYFSVAALGGETLSFEDLLVLFPVDPTYLSGYCFRRDLLSDDIVRCAFEENEANVYPHLILRNMIASLANIGIYAPGMVIKGAEANTGGDSHGHIESAPTTAHAAGRQPLNPRIYGESARAKQFYYLAPKLEEQIASLSKFHFFFAKLYLLSAWLKISIDAHKYVSAETQDVSLTNTILNNRRQQTQSGIIVAIYNYTLSVRSHTLKIAIIWTLWNVSKFVKFTLFIQRFGIRKTLDFVNGKHG